MSGIHFPGESLCTYDGTEDSRKWRFEKKIGKETKALETIGWKGGTMVFALMNNPCHAVALAN